MYATQEEVIAALTALTPDECRQLDYSARRLAFATIYATGPALFSETVERALDLRRQWCPAQMPFTQFLRNTMASISNNDRKSFQGRNISNVSDLAAADDGEDLDHDALLSTLTELPKNSVTDALEQAEEDAAMQRDYDAVYALFCNDEAVWNILDAQEQGLVGGAIKKHCGLDDDSYNAARKRLNRGVAKLKGQRIKQ